jgi:hypothetical protein
LLIIAVSIAVTIGFVGNLGVFGARWQMWHDKLIKKSVNFNCSNKICHLNLKK